MGRPVEATHALCWRAALIDLDGTLVNTLGDFEAALARALAEVGLPVVDRAFIERTVGKGSAHLLAQTLLHLGAPASLQDRLWQAYQHHYAAVNGLHATVYPGTEAALLGLRAAGLRLACLTNKPLLPARELLQRKGLAQHFEAVFGGDSFARTKPHPEPVLGACTALELRVAEVLVVGDSANDAQAAQAAGASVVLLRHGFNHGQPLEGLGALALFDGLDELPRWLAARRTA